MRNQVMKYSKGWSYFTRHPGKFLNKWFLEVTGNVAPLNNPDTLTVSEELLEVWKNFDETLHNATGPDMYNYGGSLQRERVAAVADLCASKYSGDFVEIGAQNGYTTKLLAPVAQKYGRKVIVIDPWIEGSQDCAGKEYQTFLESTKSYKDCIEVWRSSSMEPMIIEQLKKRELSFAFVDGWHILKACLSDILAVGNVQGVIAIDDTNYNHDLTFAVRRGANILKRFAYQDPTVRESYIFTTDFIRK